jgi:hypothetical protein
MIRRVLCTVIAAGWVAIHASAQSPTLPDLLKKAGDFVADYRGKVSGVALEEQMLLMEIGATQMLVPRRLTSDLVLLNISERLMALRDLYAIDTKSVRPREDRIIKALAEPTIRAWNQVQEYAREGDYQFLGNVVIWYSDPMIALRFVEREHQQRMTFRLEGRKKIDGIQVVGLGFKENRAERKAYLLGTPSNPFASGRIWIDPTTGAVYLTELWLQSDVDTCRITITYAADKTLQVPLPREGTGDFEARESTGGTYSLGSDLRRRQRFELTLKYTNPKYASVDLSKISR